MEDHSRRRDARTRDSDRRHRHEEHRHRGDGGGHRRGSRSPERKRRRSHSPDHRSSSKRHDSHRGEDHRHRHHRDRKPAPASAVSLPFSARQLTKRDLPMFEHLLADFLFIQKQKDLYEMSDREVKGRWKSFLGKWNRGELAEGWYDPETYARVQARAEEMGLERREVIPDESDEEHAESRRQQDPEKDAKARPGHGDDDDDDSDYGPTLPGTGAGNMSSGPGIPSRQDLLLRDEQRTEDRESSLTSLRLARKADRTLQKERLEDLVPRADPGTRERKLEKKQAVNDKMRSFRERSPGGEVAEGELMGGEGDELEELKKEKKREERKKSEREVRREEMERVRREEVEERRRKWQEREQGTVESLRELARQRFGTG